MFGDRIGERREGLSGDEGRGRGLERRGGGGPGRGRRVLERRVGEEGRRRSCRGASARPSAPSTTRGPARSGRWPGGAGSVHRSSKPPRGRRRYAVVSSRTGPWPPPPSGRIS